jgi:hypothetical protein
VSAGDSTGNFNTGDLTLSVSHIVGKRIRHQVRLDHKKLAVDPLNPTSNAPYSMSTYLVVDVPLVGYTLAEQGQYVAGLTGWATASSGARITQLLGGEM